MVGVLLEYVIMTACSHHCCTSNRKSCFFLYTSPASCQHTGRKEQQQVGEKHIEPCWLSTAFVPFADLLPELGASVKISSCCSHLLQEFQSMDEELMPE